MARLIALEWDPKEARIAVGNPRGSELVVEQAFTVDLSEGAPEAGPSTAEIGTRLAAEFAQRGLAGSDALVALPRSSIELRTMSLPKVPPEELPDMVRFQAIQAFTSIDEDWPLDFIELETHEESLTILAAVVSPKEVEKVRNVCATCDLINRCLVLRPFAAVSLLHRYEPIDAYRGSLVVDLSPNAADLTALSNGHVVFMRSVRLPTHGGAELQSAALVGELRRTMGAAQNQMGGSRIEQIIVCGGQSQHELLQQKIADALSLDVATFDPFAAVQLTRQLEKSLPENAGRFAPLLGMLVAEAAGTGHTIDFLNPRRRPKPPSQKRRNVLLAATAILILGAGATLFSTQKRKYDNEIARLTQESAELDSAIEKAKILVARADRIKLFTDGDITWLDELREVAARLPSGDDLILREITIGSDQERGGRIILKGNVSTAEVIAQLEESLRYGDNIVHGKMGMFDRANRDYPYQLDTTIVVPPDVQKDGHSRGRPDVERAPQSAAAARDDTVQESDHSKHDAPSVPPEDQAGGGAVRSGSPSTEVENPDGTSPETPEEAIAKPEAMDSDTRGSAPEPAATGDATAGELDGDLGQEPAESTGAESDETNTRTDQETEERGSHTS